MIERPVISFGTKVVIRVEDVRWDGKEALVLGYDSYRGYYVAIYDPSKLNDDYHYIFPIRTFMYENLEVIK